MGGKRQRLIRERISREWQDVHLDLIGSRVYLPGLTGWKYPIYVTVCHVPSRRDQSRMNVHCCFVQVLCEEL